MLLQQAAHEEHADLFYVHDPGQRRRVLHLARSAERELEQNESVVAEIEAWTLTSRSARRDGICPTVLRGAVVDIGR